MCINEEQSARPLMSDVVTALSFLGTGPDQGGANKKESLMDERQSAVEEAIEWGSTSWHNAQRIGSCSSW